MKRRMLVLFVSCFCILSMVTAARAGEAAFPQKSIDMMVGFAPGAGTDLGARMIADDAKKTLGQEILVTNKPGGGGRAAITLLARAKPDGYTLAATTDVCLTLLPNLEQVPYKPNEDFTFIVQFGSLETGVVVPADSPFKTFKEMLAYAKANPGKLTVGTLGPGTGVHVAMEAVSLLDNLKMKLVPFGGSAPAVTALLGGHVMAISSGCSGYAPHLKSKKVRLLAVMTDERNEEYPQVPTFKELGYPLVFPNFYLISGPKGMPKPVVAKLEEAFRKAMQSPAYIKIAQDLNIYTKQVLSGDDLRERILRINSRNTEVFQKLGMGLKK